MPREIHLLGNMQPGRTEAGCDEAGRGPLAGPVFAAAVILPEGFSHPLKHGKAQSRQMCFFRKDELGAGGVCFTVTPMNCFGARGKPISVEVKA